jgi:hypothetical protein
VKRSLVPMLALIAAIAAVVAPAVSARSTTTAPGYNFAIHATIKAGGQVTLDRTLAKRGWLAHFIVKNKDTKAHTFNVGGLHPKKPIAPGATAKVGAYLEHRGQFPVKIDGKVRGYFVVN